MPTISDAIRHGQREIRRQEGVAFARLLTEYEQVWWYVERIIRRYESQIQDAIDAGETVNPAWVRRQQWYQQLQRSVDDQFVRFNRTALGTIASAQTQAVGIAGESARMFAGAVNINPGIVARVNAPAFERWVSALRPGSPLQRVVDGYGDRIRESLVRRMTDGIGSGEGISTILRRVRQDVGPTAIDGRLQTFVRTEGMRAYRGSWKDQLDALPSGVITGYRWTASLSARTCLACISMHGRIFDSYPMSQHPACRCVVTPVVSPRYAPPQRFGPSGEEWLARQDEATQRRILGTADRWELYRQGTPILDFVGVKRSRTWGDSIVIKPASALREAS